MQVVAARPDALETLARATDVVFDKTGTLTQGRLRLVATHARDDDVAAALAHAAALEAFSEHPLARALRDGAPEVATTASRVVAHTGQGLEGEVAGTRYRIGSLPFVEALAGPACAALSARVAAVAPQATVVALGSDAGVEALFVLDDAERDTAGDAIAWLHAIGVRTHILSGDVARAVAAWSKHLGAGEARGGCSPADKRQAIADLQARGAVVAMIGDGVNDAPGLAQAQVSVSLGSAAPLAQWTADVVVLSDDLSRLPLAIAQARRTLSIVRQNLGWAFAYNAVAIPAAALGLVTPLVAAAGMSLSSLAVVLNALRAGRPVRRP
jgi:Cu2+-exporting ATPase